VDSLLRDVEQFDLLCGGIAEGDDFPAGHVVCKSTLKTLSCHDEMFASGGLTQLVSGDRLIAIELQAKFEFSWDQYDGHGQLLVR